MARPGPLTNVKPDSRTGEFELRVSKKILYIPARLQIVLPIPAPMRRIPFVAGRVTLEVHVALPAGTSTVSPSRAASIAAWMLLEEGLTAFTVSPLTTGAIIPQAAQRTVRK
jgi:hypothetical protein